jgi:hypothetical protein
MDLTDRKNSQAPASVSETPAGASKREMGLPCGSTSEYKEAHSKHIHSALSTSIEKINHDQSGDRVVYELLLSITQAKQAPRPSILS